MIRLQTLLSCACALVLLAIAPVHAATITYTDATSWLNATTGDTDITFAGLAPMGSETTYNNSTGLVTSGVTFQGVLSATGYQLAVVDPFYANPWFNFGGNASLETPGYDSQTGSFTPYIQATLPAGVTSFSVNLGTVSPNNLNFKITLSDGESYTVVTPSRPNTAFFGVTTDSSIASVDFAVSNASAGNGTFGLLQNFQYGQSTVNGGGGTQGGSGDAPEACTMILIGSGLLALRGLRKLTAAHGAAQA